jgi:methylmalonyl-CoA mutase N-terminal domain/subunit
VTETVDPLAGSYYVEWLTDEVERLADEYLVRIDELGGAVAAIEAGYLQGEIEQAAYEFAKQVDSGEKIVVGVNRFADDESLEPDVFPIDPALQQAQIDRVRALRTRREPAGVTAALADVAAASRGTQNLLVPMREALKLGATLGEVSDVLREAFGLYQPGD